MVTESRPVPALPEQAEQLQLHSAREGEKKYKQSGQTGLTKSQEEEKIKNVRMKNPSGICDGFMTHIQQGERDHLTYCNQGV